MQVTITWVDVYFFYLLSGPENFGDVSVKLGMIHQKVHRVLNALDADRDGDVVVSENWDMLWGNTYSNILTIYLRYYNLLFCFIKGLLIHYIQLENIRITTNLEMTILLNI